MNYIHIVAFRVLGITTSQDDIQLHSLASGYNGVLTKAPDLLLDPADRISAVASLLLTGVFIPERAPQGTPDEKVNAMVGQIREERAKAHPSASYLILSGKGEVDMRPCNSKEIDQLVVCFDAFDRRDLGDRRRPLIARAIASLAVAFPRIVGLESATEAFAFFRDDGKQVVSLTASASGDLIASMGVSGDQIELLSETVAAFDRARGLERVDLHLMQSLLMRRDKLRSFLSAWTALECFSNKVFMHYRARFYSMLGASAASTTCKFIDRVDKVMNDKYRLADKFALIAGYLNPASCEDDLAEFTKAKKLRDNFSHGEDLEVESLPTDAVRALLLKYLSLHLGISLPGKQ